MGGGYFNCHPIFFDVFMECTMKNRAQLIREMDSKGVSVKQIAASVGCSEQYVYQVKHKAKQLKKATVVVKPKVKKTFWQKIKTFFN